MLHQEARRHVDGSIDFDFYRRRAARLRARAIQKFLTRKAPAIARSLVAAAALAATVYFMPAKDGHDWNGPRPAGTTAASVPDGTIVAGKLRPGMPPRL